MHSVAVDELVAQRDDLLPHLRLLETRWERTAGALRRYCPVLERAQEMAAIARRQSWDAQRAIDQAQAALEAAAAQPPPPVPAQPAFIAAPPDHQAAIEAAQAAMDQARRLLEEAVDLRDRGEQTAAEEIDDAAHDDLRNHGGFFSFVGDIAGGVADFAGEVAGAVAGVYNSAWDAVGWIADNFPSLKQWSELLGVVGGILAVAGFFFPPLATAGLIVGAVKLGIDVALMAQGKGSWFDVGTGVLSLASFGVGRMAGSMARARVARDAARGIVDLESTVGVAGGMAGRVGTSEIGQRLTGAALRGNHLRRFREITQAFPVQGHMGTVARWGHALGPELALPARHMLSICPSAVVSGHIAIGAQAAEHILDGESILDAASTVTGGVIPKAETLLREGARLP
jgi:hypothetical protein